PCIETRADQPLLFLGKADKDVGVLPPRLTHTPKQAGKQRSSTPVVDYTIAGAHMIEVSAHQDDPVRLARQNTNQVWRVFRFHYFFGNILAARIGEESLQPRFPLRVRAGKTTYPRLDRVSAQDLKAQLGHRIRRQPAH